MGPLSDYPYSVLRSRNLHSFLTVSLPYHDLSLKYFENASDIVSVDSLSLIVNGNKEADSQSGSLVAPLTSHSAFTILSVGY
jgi:hypothetical protein